MNRRIDLQQSLTAATQKARDAGPLVNQSKTVSSAPKKAPVKPKKTAGTPTRETNQPTAAVVEERPAAQQQPTSSPRVRSDGGVVRRATLIPVSLYEQIKSDYAQAGTFGQLITWACMDYPGQITEVIVQEMTGPRRISRVPRQIGTTEGHLQTKQIAPRFLPEENSVVTALLEQIRDQVVNVDETADPSKVTRTVLHVEALRAFTRYADPDQGE